MLGQIVTVKDHNAALGNQDVQMAKATFLTAQLRESVPYLQDAGFRQTADLLAAASDEIEALQTLLHQTLADSGPAAQEANENEQTTLAARRRS